MTFLQRLIAIMPRYIVAGYTGEGIEHTCMVVTHVKGLYRLIFACKKCSFIQTRFLSDILIVDYPSRTNRFEIIYVLLSLKYQVRLLIKCDLPELGNVKSIEKLFTNANGHEREMGDLYGVLFSESTDLRRILTDYGFDGFPLRKDFPLVGYWQLRFDDELQCLVYEPVVLAQEYRIFSFNSPWEDTFEHNW